MVVILCVCNNADILIDKGGFSLSFIKVLENHSKIKIANVLKKGRGSLQKVPCIILK